MLFPKEQEEKVQHQTEVVPVVHVLTALANHVKDQVIVKDCFKG